MSVTTFEDVTVDLNTFERGIVSLFVNLFKSHVGPDHAISNRRIRTEINSNVITASRVRKIVQYIRNNQFFNDWFEGRILVANSNGYFVTNDKVIIGNWIESLENRINAMKALQEGAKEHINS